MLTVRTSSTGDGLTTVDALKQHLGLTTTSEDEKLADAILAASAAVATYIGYYPLRQSYRETVAGYGSRTLMVSRTPLTTITTMYYGSTGLVVDATEYVIDNAEAGLIVRDLGFPWSAGVEWDLDSHVVPGSERKSFIIDYTAGWVFTTDADRTLPHDLEHAALEGAKSLYLGRARDGDIAAKTVGDLSVTYRRQGDKPAGSLPDESLSLLERYRRLK